MAIHPVTTALLFALVLARVQLSACQVLKASLICLDCNRHYDLSGIKVLVKCNQAKRLAVATTEEDGSFKTELPSDAPTSPPSFNNCLVKVLGGPSQLYASKKNMVSEIVKARESDSYIISTPLKLYTSCPLSTKDANCGAQNTETGSSKIADLPLPPDWGLPPSSYYIPFLPIIGIP